MLQESKKQRVDRTFFCSFWGGLNKDWVFSLAEGSVGGMVIGWKSNLFEVWAVEASIFSLSSILSKQDLNLLGGFLTSTSLLGKEAKSISGLNFTTLVIWSTRCGVLEGIW